MLSQNQPLETEIGTRSGYFTFWMRSTNMAAHTSMMMKMANAGVQVPVVVLTTEVMVGPTAWPSVVARLRMPRSLNSWGSSTVATTYRPVLHRRPKARNPTVNRLLFVFSMFSDMFDDLLWFSLKFWLFCRPSHIGGIPGFLDVLLPLLRRRDIGLVNG